MCLFVGLPLFQSEAKWGNIHGFTPCDDVGIEKCSNEHRTCRVYEDGLEECGPCELGYVDIVHDNNSSEQINPFCLEVANFVWNHFMVAYAPFYTSADDTNTAIRLGLVTESAQMISQHNDLGFDFNPTYTLGLTPYSADAELEYEQRSGYFYVNISGTRDELPVFDPMTWAAADIPKHVDWVAKGAVTPVADQGRCGSSWAIGVCGAIEGAAFLNDGFNQSVSFQQLLSCNKRNLGCNGGSMTIAASYTANNWFGGVTTLGEYPYNDNNGVTTEYCGLKPEALPLAVEVTDVVAVVGLDAAISFQKRLELFKLALVEKPITIIMKSSCVLFSNYISGILTDDGGCTCSHSTCYDHTVLMVGYDDTGDTPYFKLKNSWGTRWGEDGYFRVAQIEKEEFGLFGIFGEGVMIDAQQKKEAEVIEKLEEQSFPVWGIATACSVAAVAACVVCVCILRAQLCTK